MAEIDYVIMLRESLEKKVDVLKVIQVRNKEQMAILQDPNSTPDELEENMNKKQELIDAILSLDNGFEILFKRVQDIFSTRKEEYADEIKHMKALIKEITDLTVDIQAMEQKNKEYAMAKFSSIKQEAREIKKSHAVVSSYYKSMMAPQTTADPAFLDNRK